VIDGAVSEFDFISVNWGTPLHACW